MAKTKREHYKVGAKKGQFKPGKAKSAKKTKKKKATKSKTKRKATSKSKRKTANNPKKRRRSVPKKKKRRRRAKSGGGKIHDMKTKGKVFAAGAGLGYLEMKSAADIAEGGDGGWFESIPTIETVGPDATKAVILYLIAENTKGFWREWADMGSLAMSGKAGYEFGANDFKFKEETAGVGHHKAGHPAVARNAGNPAGNEICGEYEYEEGDDYEDDDDDDDDDDDE